MLSVYIAGLKKGCGKTLIASGFAGTMQSLSYAVSYYKPVQTGAYIENNEPAPNDVYTISRIDHNIKGLTTYSFQNPTTPLIGAYNSGIKKIDLNKIYNDYKINTQMTECHIIEGCNSISTPVDEKITEADIAKIIGVPVVLVVNPKQNNIDDVISGINYIHTKKLQFMGVIVNEYDDLSANIEDKYFPQLIKEYTGAKVLGCFPHFNDFANIGADTVIAETLNRLDLEEIFGIKIAKLG